MAEITAKMVADLRAATGLGMMECKKALVETEGDVKAAEELLRIKSGAKASKLAGRTAAEGVVAQFISADGKVGALVEVNCETDFVGKDEGFVAFAKAVAQAVVTGNPADVEALAAVATAEGPTVEETRKALIAKLGENMSVRRFVRYETAGKVAAYLHGAKIGVLVDLAGGEEQVGKDVAMHIAAMKPVALTSADVPAELIAKERSVAEGKADEANKELIAAGKPAQSAEITAKRIDGAVQKYLKEVSLADQVFVKAADGKQTVAQMLKAANTTVKSFTLYVVGEGIEKKVDDFAAEVAAQVAAAKAAA